MKWAPARAFSRFGEPERRFLVAVDVDLDPDDGVPHIVLGDGGENLVVGVRVARLQGDADEGTARRLVQPWGTAAEALTPWLGRVEFEGHEAFGGAGIAEVDLLEGAGVPAGRVGVELHGVVVVAQRDIIKAIEMEGAERDPRDAAALHPVLAAFVLGHEPVAEGEVAGEDGGHVGVDAFRLRDDDIGDGPLDELVELLDGGPLRLLAVGEQVRDLRPGHEGNLQRSGAGLEDLGNVALALEPGGVADGDVGNLERAKDLEGVGAGLGVGEVVVADEEEGGDAGLAEAADAPGEFALVRLGGLARLVGVAREDDGVDAFLEGVVDEVVEGIEKVLHARGPGLAREGPSVELDANVQIGEMEYAHQLPPSYG